MEGRIILWLSLAIMGLMSWAAWLWYPWLGATFGVIWTGYCLWVRRKLCFGCRNRCPYNPNWKKGVFIPAVRSGGCFGMTRGEGLVAQLLGYILLAIGFYAIFRWHTAVGILATLFTLWMWYGVYRPRVCAYCENACPWNPDPGKRFLR